MNKHYEENQLTFDLWIETKTRLQPSQDLIQPFIAPFKKEFPTVNLDGCPECLIDMLVWAKSEWKKSIKPKK